MKLLEIFRKKWKRPWGHYEVLHEGTNDQKEWKVKYLKVEPVRYLSLQHHQMREEFWVCVKGKGKVILNGMEIEINEGKRIHIPIRQKHQLINTSNSELVIIEVQYGDLCCESDITRWVG